MKKAYFYVGGNQRLAGEVKKLGKPYAVVGLRRGGGDGDAVMGGVGGDGDGMRDEGEGEAEAEELEILQVVKYKVVFSSRPEPVGGEGEEG